MRHISIEHMGGSLTISQWAKALGIPRGRIKSRWDRGIRDPKILLHKHKFKADSGWDYSHGDTPVCLTHKIKAVWYKNSARNNKIGSLKKGQWSCVSCLSIRAKKSRERRRNTFGYQLNNALWSARSRADCELTVSDIREIWNRQNGLCAITKIPMQKTPGRITHNRFKFSLDRIDNNEPYLKSNVWLVCEFVNRAKGDLSDDELVLFAKGIFENFTDRAIVS